MKDVLLQSCVDTIAREGWSGFSFDKASKHSGIPLAEYRARFENSTDVMKALFEHIDAEMLKSLEGEDFSDCTPHEALFEIMLARLDVSSSYKECIGSFWAAKDVPGALCLAPVGFASSAWMLERAGMGTRGLQGALRIRGLMGLYLLTLHTWLDDESPDMSKTMAFLDQGLSRLDRLAKALNLGL